MIQNDWIGYIERGYQQMKEAILTKVGVQIPEMTDHTESNIFVKMIEIWCGIGEMIQYYIDRKAEETFLSTQKRYDSAVKIAKMFDYRIRGVIAASVELEFTLNAIQATNVTIPAGTIVQTADEIQFVTLSAAVITAGQLNTTVQAEQKTLFVNQTIGTSDGSAYQEFVIGQDVFDGSVTAVVNTITYSAVNTLAFSNSTDKVFVAALNGNQELQIRFGDGINGFIPDNGQDIVVTYATSLGSRGNLAENTIDEIVTNLTLPTGASLTVNNPDRASGGEDVETLNDLKQNIPLSIRTLNRAVTEQDFIDIATLVPGVAKADVNYDCGREVDVFVVPEGGGIASQTLLDNVKDAFHDETRLILVSVNPRPAGEVLLLLEVEIEVLPVYNRLITIDRVLANLEAFGSVDQQDISGTVNIGDLYQVVENTEGVKHSVVRLLSHIPTSQIVTGTSELDFTVSVNQASTAEIQWIIKHVNDTTFELIKGGVILSSTLTYGQSYALGEINLQVNNPGTAYVVGDIWQFNSYAYNTLALELNEPSIPIIRQANVNLTATGGV